MGPASLAEGGVVDPQYRIDSIYRWSVTANAKRAR